jgi:hypothetical protein
MSGCEKKCFFEAVFLLAISSLCIKFVAFRRIDNFLRSRKGAVQSSLSREREVKLVQLSILRATKPLPWNVLCLSQSIAEYVMLRRRGIPATILAGVRFDGDRSLNAHAWVASGLSKRSKDSETSGSYTVVMRIGCESPDR